MAPQKKRRTFMAFCSMVYMVCMCYLLFLRRLTNGRADGIRRYAQEHGYRQAVRNFIQPIPLRTIRNFYRSWRFALQRNGFDLWNYAFINNAGNVLIFVPLGFILPYFWKAQRNPLVFLFTTTLLIGCVEVTQVLLLLGCCDVDDLILNTAGCVIGYLLYGIFYLMFRRHRHDRTHHSTDQV